MPIYSFLFRRITEIFLPIPFLPLVVVVMVVVVVVVLLVVFIVFFLVVVLAEI